MSAAGILNVDGTLLGQADGNLRAGTDITGRGKLAFGTGATLRAGRDISLTARCLQVTSTSRRSTAFPSTTGKARVTRVAATDGIPLKGYTSSEQNLTLTATNGAISTSNAGAQRALTANAGTSLTTLGDTTAKGLSA